MKKRKQFFLIILIFLGSIQYIFAQGDRCSSIQPFCAGNEKLIFPNSNFSNNDLAGAEFGPNYDCLLTQPYPAWFYLQVGEPGDLELTILQTQNPDGSGNLYDVDFILWGPFEEGEDFCSNTALSSVNQVDCSYSPAPREQMTITGAKTNEIYVILITNFSTLPGYISLQQTNVTGGSTDCSIVGSTLGPDQVVCGDESVILDATNPSATEYIWYVYNEDAGDYDLLPTEVDPTLTVTTTGNYKVTVRSDILDAEASDDVFIEFFEILEINGNPEVTGCLTNDASLYDLTSVEADLIGNNTGNYRANFYLDQDNYEAGNPISTPTFFQSEQQTVLATIIDEENGCESLPVEISLKVGDIPGMEWEEIIQVCVNSSGNFVEPVFIGTQLGPNFSYNWNVPNDPDGDGVQNAVLMLLDFPSNPIITLNIVNNETGCRSEFSTELKALSAPAEVGVDISGNDFENGGYIVTANAIKGPGDETTYEYRIGDGNWQLNPVFTNVPGGRHRVVAREINGCGITYSQPFILMGYPRFLTPNNDGYNDNWNIINDSERAVRIIRIFDRYGKLIKELNPASAGWDGTFNGRQMPADDYWFLIDYRDPLTDELQQFKGHFTLKR